MFNDALLKANDQTIEFDNTEFQEYLAALEVSKLTDASRSLFKLAIDPVLKEIYPSWFNALTFFVDLNPIFFTNIRLWKI